MNKCKKNKILGWVLFAAMATLWFMAPISAAEVTASDVLNKVQENINTIGDISAEITTTAHIGPQSTTVRQTRYYFKKPDRYKIETLAPEKQTILIVGGNASMKIGSEAPISMGSGQPPAQPQFATPLSVPGVGQQFFGVDMAEMLENFNVTLNNTLSDEKSNLYVLDFSLKKSSSYSSPSGAFSASSRIEAFVDYEKGLATKYKAYDQNNALTTITEIKETKQIGNLRIPTAMLITVFLPNKQEAKLEMGFENLEINAGIADSKFAIE